MKLKEIVEICYGKNQKHVEVNNSEIPILGTGGIIGYSSVPLYSSESVLIGRKGTIDMPFYVKKPFWTIDTLFYTKINKNIVIPKYLYYLLCTIGLNKYSEGAAVPSLTTKTLYEIDLKLHSKVEQQHIVDTIGSVDDLIENYQNQIDKIIDIIRIKLSKYSDKICNFADYNPTIIKSGILSFDKNKIYLDTSTVEGINNISSGDIISYNKRPSRANMQPANNTIWFAKMKGSNKIIVITDNDYDLIDNSILSTGFMGLKATKKLPLSFLTGIIMSDNFLIQRDLNSVGTTMSGINNETFLKIQVPFMTDEDIKEFDSFCYPLIKEMSLLRRKIKNLLILKQTLLKKYY